ncbi:restriction endonuclease [Streptomyces prunicolor]
MTTRQARQKPDKEVFWRAYERQIAEVLAAVDPNASVRHNASIVGYISGVPRQIDALAVGTIAGQKLKIVAEAKCRSRKVNIEMIDGFVGKLLDLGAERGIFYSSAGFTEGAIGRAERQRNPSIALVNLARMSRPTAGDVTAYTVPVCGNVVSGPSMGRVYQASRDQELLFRGAGIPMITGPIAETYEEFLRGEGFLYIDD